MKRQDNKIKIPTFKILGRLVGTAFKYHPVKLTFVMACVVLVAMSGISSTLWISLLTKNLLDPMSKGTAWAEVYPHFIQILIAMIVTYLIGFGASLYQNYTMAFVVQDFLLKTRKSVFYNMENLPIRYFDTHNHGDIMSTYTNDIDATRQLIGIALPQLFNAFLCCFFSFIFMLVASIWLWLVVMAGAVLMIVLIIVVGGKSGQYFVKQQHTIGEVEGFVEEMMGGQRVIKVFNHEEAVKEDFTAINEKYFKASSKANAFANSLMPAIMNIGNLMYVATAIVGIICVSLQVKNISILGMHGVITITIVVAFINLSRQFSINLGQMSMQTNAVVVGVAGASRVFELLDQKREEDGGYIELVSVQKNIDGHLEESLHKTGLWAWKDKKLPTDNKLVEVKGEVIFKDVYFGYVENKTILHDINLFAKPGQKIAFVGATGAGKTTITNLINRFYDIQSGQILYDGIDIAKIKKEDLRRSLGIVLQDTNLFTGTILENIRYGKLDATDDECIAAAKLANAHEFITRLPDGYQTMLKHEASNLSQGQRQLISIARAAVANPPVMILDEATSSIDTRTELLVQKGMDSLMEGRTVFVIAHRLSTIQNSDCIMVLDKGRIIERGNHESLLNERGIYYQLCTGALEIE